MKPISKLFFLLLFLLFMLSCEQNYTPKPRGYLRIDLPKKAYVSYDSLENYRFSYPAYARVVNDLFTAEEEDWINIEFPDFDGNLHLSYKAIDNNLSVYVEDARNLLMQHMPKASGISDSLVVVPERNIYGVVNQLSGKGVASPLQFYLTDSTNHFIRAALYFNIRPNNDSMAPVIEFIKQDIRHLINTLEWK
jgi:gliding motility-associated lipoprotein GldD